MPSYRTVSQLALVAAGLYAATGAIELAHDQPTVFADPIDYWLEAIFVAALAASVAVLTWLARAGLSGRPAAFGWTIAAVGHAGLLVAATATAIDGREALDPLFGLGFLAIVAGYVTLAVVDLRSRLSPSRAGLVLLAGFAATAVVDNVTDGAGGLVLAATWAALGRVIATREPSTERRPASGVPAQSAS